MESAEVQQLARGLVRAEERLRAEGLTGARAFTALRDAVRARLGEPVDALDAAVDAVQDLPLGAGVDLFGLAYERFFADLFKGRRGQYFTPRPLVELLLSRLSVGPGDDVLDPTCGSGGFLVQAGARGARVRGIELDPLLADLARLNLAVAGVEGQIVHADFFTAEPDPVDVVVANPPFSVPIRDPAVLGRYSLGRGRRQVPSDWLFCEALERWVKPGGRAGLVLPYSLLASPSFEPVRARLAASWHREALCALPEGVFRPFGGAAGRAVLLWLVRERSARSTRWAELQDPGYDVRSIHYRPTDPAEIEALADPARWETLPDGAWTPSGGGEGGRPLAELARASTRRVRPDLQPEAPFGLVDLADTDKATGEVSRVQPLPGARIRGLRPAVRPGDLLVARLRPELGNVAIARRPAGVVGELVGSPEWIVLEARDLPHFTLHALRTPSWRDALPVTGGQTRPRTSPEAVLSTRVPWPGEPVARRIDQLSQSLHTQRAALRDRLDALQDLVDRFAAGELDADELNRRVAALEAGPVGNPPEPR